MSDLIRVGTRKSKLARWQAEWVQQKLTALGLKSELVFITSQGDKVQDQAVQQIGPAGVFTKALDKALLEKEVDVAVHSYKDVPTQLEKGTTIGGVLKRGETSDVLVLRKDADFLKDEKYSAVIATGSPRRKAQWLNRYPNHKVVGIRGNVDSRLEKLKDSDWDGTILALAGLVRLSLDKINYLDLNWMIPAPAQGAIALMARKDDTELLKALEKVNDFETALATKIERDFLRALEGGCVAPIGAHAKLIESKLYLQGCILSEDGQERIDVEIRENLDLAGDVGLRGAREALEKGAADLISK